MSNYTILLIDYEPKSIERARRPLKTAGYRVEVASDGVSGIEVFQRIRPDLVIIEAMIPKKHGFEVCQELKKTPVGKRTPIIITTSVYKGRKYRNQAFHLHGCDEYIEKPIDEQDLITICRRLLRDKGDQAVASMAVASATETIAVSEEADASSSPAPDFLPAAPQTMDDDEMEILARLDAILPGSQKLKQDYGPKSQPESVAAMENVPIDAVVPEDTFHTIALPAEPSPVSFETGPPYNPSSIQTILEEEGLGKNATVADETVGDEELQVVSFENRRSRKKDRRKKKASPMPPGGRTVAAAAPAVPDEVSFRAPRTEAVPRLPASPRKMPELETRRQAAEVEPVVTFTEEPSALWLWITVTLLLIVAAGALIYLSLGTPLNT